MGPVARSTRRALITVAGTALIAVGCALLVLPGPGLLLIFAGLAVLATEYSWARNLLDRVKARVARRRDA